MGGIIKTQSASAPFLVIAPQASHEPFPFGLRVALPRAQPFSGHRSAEGRSKETNSRPLHFFLSFSAQKSHVKPQKPSRPHLRTTKHKQTKSLTSQKEIRRTLKISFTQSGKIEI
jgi:hypothetical protein